MVKNNNYKNRENNRNLELNNNDTEAFLSIISGDGDLERSPFTFQTFPESSEAKGKPETLFGSYHTHQGKLIEANQAGMAVTVMINQGDQAGRKLENVTKIRALFVDLDGSPLAPIKEATAKPHIIVESSQGKYHAYWLISDCPLEQFKTLQKALGKKFNGDHKVSDLARVMRIPGFLHQKNEPFCSMLKETNSSDPYTIEEIIEGLELDITLEAKSAETTSPKCLPIEEIAKALEHIDPDTDYLTWVTIGMSIKHSFSDQEGLDLFEAWSSKGKSYKQGECQKKWNSFLDSYTGTPATVGTIIHIAKKQGYKVPKKSKLNNQERIEPTDQDYYLLFKSVPDFQRIQRDLVSRELMVLTESDGWVPIYNRIGLIESYAIDSGLHTKRIKPYLARYEYEYKSPELLIDIPQYNGLDYLREICETIKFKEFNSNEVYEILLTFLVTMFRRIKDPSIQPKMLVIKGAQGVGKDTLIEALLGGLESYFKDLDISHEEAESFLHRAVVFRINEFDRAAKTNVATLKHLLTTPKTYVREKYGRTAQDREVRCSYVSTCNVDDFLRDTTGNRRYWILEMEYGGFPPLYFDEQKNLTTYSKNPDNDYPGMFNRPNKFKEQKQILAMAKSIADSGNEYYPSETTIEKMDKIVGNFTPEDPRKEAEQLWNELAEHYAPGIYKGTCWLPAAVIDELGLWKKISEGTGLKIAVIKKYLKDKGYTKKTQHGRGYIFKTTDSMDFANDEDTPRASRFAGITFSKKTSKNHS